MRGEKGLLQERSKGARFGGSSVLRLPVSPRHPALPLQFRLFSLLPCSRTGAALHQGPVGLLSLHDARTSCGHVLPRALQLCPPLRVSDSTRRAFVQVSLRAWKGDFTLEDDSYSVTHPWLQHAPSVPIITVIYVHLEKTQETENRQSSNSRAAAQIEAAAQRARCPPAAAPPVPLKPFLHVAVTTTRLF